MTERGNIIVVSSIDVGIGKTVATGLIARWFKDNSSAAVTMKMVQTGGEGLSTDIMTHRRLADSVLLEEDAMGLTCPYILKADCDPYLAATLDRRVIDPDVIVAAADELATTFDHVLIEGTAGLFAPLTDTVCAVDLYAAQQWPVILVTGPRPGSINHTLAALDALTKHGVALQGMVFNLNGSSEMEPRIVADTRHLFTKKLAELECRDRICDIPDVSCTVSYCVDFSALFA